MVLESYLVESAIKVLMSPPAIISWFYFGLSYVSTTPYFWNHGSKRSIYQINGMHLHMLLLPTPTYVHGVLQEYDYALHYIIIVNRTSSCGEPISTNRDNFHQCVPSCIKVKQYMANAVISMSVPLHDYRIICSDLHSCTDRFHTDLMCEWIPFLRNCHDLSMHPQLCDHLDVGTI